MQEHLGVEERPEPRIEVVPEEPKSGPDPMKPAGTQPKKRWIWLGGGLSLVLLLVAAYWAFWQRGPAVKEKTPELAQLQGLQGQVQKLERDWNQLRKEMDFLQGEQKGLSDQMKALKDQVAAFHAKTERPPEKKEAPKAISYKVKKGDTLQTIAKRFQVQPEDIRKWNRLGTKGELRPGKMLTLYPQS